MTSTVHAITRFVHKIGKKRRHTNIEQDENPVFEHIKVSNRIVRLHNASCLLLSKIYEKLFGDRHLGSVQ